MAIRVAVGAAPGRLVRQLLTESALLALAGGAAGVLLAAATVGVVGRVLPARLLGLPGVDRVTVDLRVLTITLAATLATGIAFGLVPAWAAVREGTGATLNEEGRSGTTGTYAQRVRAALVVAEMALSLMLLIGAGLLLVSFKRLVDVSP